MRAHYTDTQHPKRLWVCALGGDFGNLDAVARVSMLGAITLGWREAGRQEREPQGASAACRGCREGGTRAHGEEIKSQEQARNILGTC